jgi:hypothetical protein
MIILCNFCVGGLLNSSFTDDLTIAITDLMRSFRSAVLLFNEDKDSENNKKLHKPASRARCNYPE